MHNYLRTVGFYQVKSKKHIDKILEYAVEKPDYVKESIVCEGEYLVEIRKMFGEQLGITIIGIRMEDSTLIDIEYYFPFYIDNVMPEKEEISMQKHIANHSFAGVCDDIRIGVSLIFFLQNVLDYTTYFKRKRRMQLYMPVSFRGFSNEGKILFPVQKSLKEIQKSKVAIQNRKRLIEEARRGDESAIESLTMEDLDTYNQISRRVLREDVFSIVDNCFMPYGIECDQYSVVGDIEDVKIFKNDITSEQVYCLSLACNEINFSVIIHEKDLLGEPAKGRRFKGSIWLQGYVHFELS